MNWLVVCPIILPPPATAEARAHWDVNGPDLLLVDNTTNGAYFAIAGQQAYNYFAKHGNLGVSRAWNMGIELAMNQNRDGIVILSSSMMLTDGLKAAVETMAQESDMHGCLSDQAWHLIGFRLHTFNKIGRFDDLAFPSGYYADNDYLYRMKLGGIHDDGVHVMPKVYPRGSCENAAALKAGVVTVDMGEAKNAYVRKWNGTPGEETFTTPYDVQGAWIGWTKNVARA